MAVNWSDAVRNAVLDAWETAMGTSAKIQVYTGSKPANCAASATGTKLLEYSLGSNWATDAASAQKTLASLPLETTGLADGNAGYYRFVNSAGSTCHEQGTVTATGGGGDMTIDNIAIATSQVVRITGYTKTAPHA
ncbi:MAG: hypothetical protein AB7G13_30200 [Lautropia sp.]